MTHLVRGLSAPTLLVDMLNSNRWVHPGDDVIRQAVPFIHDPLEFLSSLDRMEQESGSLNSDADSWMHEYCGRNCDESRDLPWLDTDLAFFVAINACIGDDLAIALDYRNSRSEPRVVATEWTDDGCFWRHVADSFPHFVALIHL